MIKLLSLIKKAVIFKFGWFELIQSLRNIAMTEIRRILKTKADTSLQINIF
jgi:hypothetical protein